MDARTEQGEQIERLRARTRELLRAKASWVFLWRAERLSELAPLLDDLARFGGWAQHTAFGRLGIGTLPRRRAGALDVATVLARHGAVLPLSVLARQIDAATMIPIGGDEEEVHDLTDVFAWLVGERHPAMLDDIYLWQ